MRPIPPLTRDQLNRIRCAPAVQWVLLAFCLNLLVDILNQRSFSVGLLRLFTHPLTVLYNLLLILLTVALSGLFRKKVLATLLCSLPWLALAVVNFILQSFRATPLSAVDFTIIFSVLPILDSYLTPWQMVLAGTALAAVAALLIWAGIKCRKRTPPLRASVITLGITVLLLLTGTNLCLHSGAISSDYDNLILAYKDYGLPYCFVNSVLDRGIDEPDDYNSSSLQETLEDLLTDATDPEATFGADTNQQPNVIFLQLESFIDSAHFLNLTYSEDPTPVFRALKQKYPSGSLTVPTLGAGTVNTEFEVMTGMSLDYFGTGEYPYTTVLMEQATESIAFNLKEHGYYATAIHNNSATFYDRNYVFANLGYDRFVSSEYMTDLSYTSVGWCKDLCLVPQITKALNATKQADLVYAISVQPHGKYPQDQAAVAGLPIRVTPEGEYDEALHSAYTYYINQLKEVDDFLKQLTDTLAAYPEPVMLVLFGDHLPNFNAAPADMHLQDLFKTEYVIWTNYPLEKEDADLYTYQLTAQVLEAVGINTGALTKLHQGRTDNPDYYNTLEMMEYDMLFGEKYIWDGKCPYQPTDMQLGYDDIAITSMEMTPEGLLIRGTGFTDSSVVYFGILPQETVLRSSTELLVKADKPGADTGVTVRQLSSDGVELTATPPLKLSQSYTASK